MLEKILKTIVYSVIFSVGILLTIIGNALEGWRGVWLMILGIGSLIVLLYMYNRKFR